MNTSRPGAVLVIVVFLTLLLGRYYSQSMFVLLWQLREKMLWALGSAQRIAVAHFWVCLAVS